MAKKLYLPVLLLILLGVGVSSAMLFRIVKPSPINILTKTKGEATGIIIRSDTALQIYPFRVEGELYFAGERVPLEDPDVRERLDRELQINIFRQSNTVLDIKLANRFFPEIEKILTEEGVPSDFKYLPLIESDFRDVVSPSGAAGFWQFLPATAKTYGLEINNDIDERYHVEKSTRAACQYLKKAKERLGSWTAAAASYNFGMEGVASKLESQNTTNYYDLSITAETARYIFRMLAMKVIFSDPMRAGYHFTELDLYQPTIYNTVEMDSTINDLPAFAAIFSLRMKDLRMLNMWMRSTTLPNKARKTYQIRIMQR